MSEFADVVEDEKSLTKTEGLNLLEIFEEVELLCDKCSKSFKKLQLKNPEKFVDSKFNAEEVIAPTNWCDLCSKSFIEDREKERVVSSRLIEFNRINPFKGKQKTDFKKLPDKQAAREAFSHDWNSGLGLMLHGPTGSGKTRVAYPCVEKAIKQGLSFYYLDSSILRTIALRPYDSRELKDPCFTNDLLFWDDYGNDSDSPAVEDLIWDITKYRNEHGMLMLVSTQFTDESLKGRFRSPERGQSIVRRLNESCVPVNFSGVESSRLSNNVSNHT